MSSLSINSADFRSYPRLTTLLAEQNVVRYQRWRQQREAELIHLIREKVEHSSINYHPLTLYKISEIIGVTRSTVRRHPDVYSYASALVEESQRLHRHAR
jgi:hypothetical protein